METQTAGVLFEALGKIGTVPLKRLHYMSILVAEVCRTRIADDPARANEIFVSALQIVAKGGAYNHVRVFELLAVLAASIRQSPHLCAPIAAAVTTVLDQDIMLSSHSLTMHIRRFAVGLLEF
jgi:hypothetical protein